METLISSQGLLNVFTRKSILNLLLIIVWEWRTSSTLNQQGNRIRWYKWLIFASTLKILRHEFGNTLSVAQLHLKSMFDKPQIKSNQRAVLWEFHQQIKLINLTWLLSFGYKTHLYFCDRFTKALLCLLYICVKKEFYKFRKDSSLIDGSLDLITLGKWKAYFNPLSLVQMKDKMVLSCLKLKQNSFKLLKKSMFTFTTKTF